MFVRLKKSRGTRNFYLVRNVRRDGKVVQETLAYLGTEKSGCNSVRRALTYWRRELKRAERELPAATSKESAARKEVVALIGKDRRLAASRLAALEIEREIRRKRRKSVTEYPEKISQAKRKITQMTRLLAAAKRGDDLGKFFPDRERKQGITWESVRDHGAAARRIRTLRARIREIGRRLELLRQFE